MSKIDQPNDGYGIRYWYNDPCEQFSHYANDGVVNLLDRDCWNNKLSDRTFLIDYPPWYNIVYPQNTSLCIKHDSNKVLDNSELNKASLEYFDKYNRCVQCPLADAYASSGINGVPTKKGLCNENQYIETNPKNLVRSCKSPKVAKNIQKSCTQSQTCKTNEETTPYLYQGINRNIDSESKLFGINYYNNNDCVPNDICPNSESRNDSKTNNLKTRRELFNIYFRDERHIYPNMTPKPFHNMTKIINNYPIGVDYHKYNRYICDAERCFAACNARMQKTDKN